MNKSKIVISIISIVLVLAILAGLTGYLSGGFKNWNVKDWFGKEDTPDDNKTDDNKTETKERSVAFDLKFDTLDEENGYYTATLTKDQKAALLDYPNTYFFAELSGEYNGEEQAKVKIPMFFFTSYDTSEGNIGIGFSDTGSSECSIAFILPVLGNDNTGKFEAIAMSEMTVNFTLTYAEDSVPVGKALMDYVNASSSKEDNDVSTDTLSFVLDETTAVSGTYSEGRQDFYSKFPVTTSLPAASNCNGKIIIFESIHPVSGEVFPAKTVEVTWEYTSGTCKFTGKGSNGQYFNGEYLNYSQWTSYLNKLSNAEYAHLTAYYTKADNKLVSIEGHTSSYACEVFFYQ